MTKRAVAIITRTKNRPILLRRAFQSVVGQTFGDWEMVIINDGGEPGPVEMLVEEYRAQLNGRIHVIHHEKSKGMEAASNVGLRASASDFCVIHDDDDSWHPSFLQETVAFLRAENTPAAVQGVITHSIRVQEKIVDDEVHIIERDAFNDYLKSISLFKLAYHNQFPPISFLYRRSALEHIGYYREDLPVLGDWEFNLRFVRAYEIAVMQKSLAYYHHRTTVKSGIYGNTIIAGKSDHDHYDALIRNELLRADLDAGRFGLGTVLNIAKIVGDLRHEQQQLRYVQQQLRNAQQHLSLQLQARFRESFFSLKDRIYNSARRFGVIRG